MVETPQDLLVWRKSSRCVEGQCVEVGIGKDYVFLRDSKNVGGPSLRFSGEEWKRFLTKIIDQR